MHCNVHTAVLFCRANEEGISPAMVAQKALEASQGQVGHGNSPYTSGGRVKDGIKKGNK